MNCASCGRTNRAGARFCGGCGASLAPRCPACGAAGEPDSRFCDACGASFSPRAADDGVARKVVTILFADLIGSTALHERLDPESVSRLMEGYHRAVGAAVEAHGGTVVQLLGDGVMCAFGVPRVAEDDALRAVRAAIDVQRAFREFAREQGERVGKLGLRVALNTGEVVVSDDYSAGIGDPLNVAARLQQEARDGDVLIGEATQRHVAGQVTLARVGSFALKGRAEPVTAYRVESLERPTGAAAVAFVGRGDELRRLTAVYESAVAAPAARLAVLLGSPGLGKSRLLGEFTSRLGERAIVLTAACNAAGGATFAPLVEALRSARAAVEQVDEAERARIASGIDALLAGTPASPEETFFVVRRLLAALATKLPVVLAIDDLHWAEPLLLDLVEHLVQWGAGVPLLVLAAARPELRDARSSLASAGGLVADVVTLGGLDAGAATRLAASVIGTDALPAALAGRVLATSEGNPLFLGELVRMLVNDGVLRREGDRWTAAAELAQLEMPPTIQALLAARIERLRPEERLVLERASVVGRQFSRTAVAHLLPPEARGELDARLESLRRSELIEPDGGWMLGEPMLRFHHVLIRDAAYRRLLRHTRADLHARFAHWLVGRSGADAAPLDETIGWHLEQAHQHLRELGALDAAGRELGARAAKHLAAAGRRALARDDLPPAGGLLGRALDCLDAADPARAELVLDWCEALLAAGEVGPAKRAVDELARLAGASERLAAWHVCFAGQLAVLSDPQALRGSVDAVAAAAALLGAAGDAAGEAKAHSVHALLLAQLGKIGACETALDLALAAARRAKDRRRANAVLAGAPVAALWGPSPVTRASGRCLDVVRVLRITQGAPAVEAVALRCQAVLETLRGRSEAARRMLDSSRQMVEKLGLGQRLLEVELFAGLIDLLEGDAASAEQKLRVAFEGLRERRLDIDAAQAAALLGQALLRQGRAAEAEALSHESEKLAGDSFKAAIAWRGVRAEALASRGESGAALALARAAVEIAAATDDLLDHADARQALAAALRAAGRAAEAQAEQRRAIALWEEKGASLLAERARREAGSTPAPEPRAAVSAAAESGRPRRVRANAATAHSLALTAVMSERDERRLPALFNEQVEVTHHPTGVVFGPEASLQRFRATLHAEGLVFAHVPVAALGESLALSHSSTSFARLDEGDISIGAHDAERFVLVEVDGEGRALRVEIFAEDRLADAVIRLYERHAERLPAGPARERFAVIARVIGMILRWEFPPIEELERLLHPDVHLADHRRLGMPSGRGLEQARISMKALYEVADQISVDPVEIIALDEVVLLLRVVVSGRDRATGGAFERPELQLRGFAADGRFSHVEMFDSGAVEAALARAAEIHAARAPVAPRRPVRENAATRNAARLDAAADERPPLVAAFQAAFAARDWSALAALLAPDLVVHDHRPLGWEPLRGPAPYVAALRSLVELAPDVALEIGRVELGAGGFLCRPSWVGTREGGPFEAPSVFVTQLDGEGRIRRFDQYDASQLEAARARLAELRPDPLRIPPNAATRFSERMVAALTAQDLAGAEALTSDHARFEDRRAGVRMTGDRSLLLDNYRYFVSQRIGSTATLLATLGDRIAVQRLRFHRLDDADSFEVEALQVSEVDAEGRLLVAIVFDASERAAAGREALDRYFRGVGARYAPPSFVEFLAALNDHDARRARAALPDEFVFDDRRRTGVGRLGNADDYVASLAAVWEQSPDAHAETLYHVAVAPHGSLSVGRMFGTQGGGGEFESLFVRLNQYAAAGVVRTELFELEDLELARARFEELRPDPLRIPPNAATRAAERNGAFLRAGDWEGLRAFTAPDFHFDDRRKLALVSGSVDMYVENLRVVHAYPGLVTRREILCTAGERVALAHLRYEGGAPGSKFHGEFLLLLEVDADGRVRSALHFDPEDRAEAFAAAWRRFSSGEAGRAGPDPVSEFAVAFTRHDWDGLRRCLAEQAVVWDRRPLGFETFDREGWLASLRVLAELAPDVRSEPLRLLAWNRRGRASLTRVSGTTRDGAEFETVFVSVFVAPGAQIERFERFDLAELDSALARFEELTAG